MFEQIQGNKPLSIKDDLSWVVKKDNLIEQKKREI